MAGVPLFERLTRRSFLKHSGLGLAGLLLPWRTISTLPELEQSPTGSFGRVLESPINLYTAPTRTSAVVKTLWKDLVLPITRITVGDQDPPYNRIWYRLGNEGYAHSGEIQPVRVEVNNPVDSLPEIGRLVQISVPFTDTRWGPSSREDTSYRLYYATTHWAVSVHTDEEGNSWYGLYDARPKSVYYALARHVRLLDPADYSPLSPEIPPERKRLEVQLEHQAVIAYEDDRPVFMARAATGGRFSTGNYSTQPGRYIIDRKSPSNHMAAGDRAAPNSYDLPGVPWISYFTEDGISFHGTYWHNDYGKPRSHGCVNLSPEAARWVYRWALPAVSEGERMVFKPGTPVDVI